MAGYGDIVASSQDLYSASAEGSAGFSEGIGEYRGEMREIDAKEKRINQIGDAAFSLFQGYSEGKQEHTEAGQAAEAAGFDYEQPESLWETWKGVDEGASFSRIGESKENFGRAQTITGTELKNMSDLYKAGGMKAVGDVDEYGKWRDTDTKGWSPKSSNDPIANMKALTGEGYGQDMKADSKFGVQGKGNVSQIKINELMKEAEGHDARLRATYDTNAMDDMGITYGKTSIAKQLAGGDSAWQTLLQERESPGSSELSQEIGQPSSLNFRKGENKMQGFDVLWTRGTE